MNATYKPINWLIITNILLKLTNLDISQLSKTSYDSEALKEFSFTFWQIAKGKLINQSFIVKGTLSTFGLQFIIDYISNTVKRRYLQIAVHSTSPQQIKFSKKQIRNIENLSRFLSKCTDILLYFYLSKNVAIECNSVWNIETSVGYAGIPHGSYVCTHRGRGGLGVRCTVQGVGWVTAASPPPPTYLLLS